jgi:hypothetical protein
MPFNAVFAKYKAGKLHSGSQSGPPVTSHRQAVAIYMSEKKKAEQGNKEYQSSDEHPMRRAFGRPRGR